MKPLQTVEQHWSVLLLENGATDLDDPVRAYPDEVFVIRSVMQFAKGKAVWNDRFSPFLIRNDMSSVQELTMLQTANRALGPICKKDSLTKRPLMDAKLKFARHIPAPLIGNQSVGGLTLRYNLVGIKRRRIVELDGEGESVWVISDDQHRPRREVASGNETEKVDERDPLLHERTESLIVAMIGVSPAIGILEASPVARPVIVRTIHGGPNG